jgi:hypothetical protein
MKNLFNLFVVAAFLVSATLAFAADQAKPGVTPAVPQAEKTINCCVKGECKKLGTEADCTKAGGKVVKDCKDCGGK